MMNEISKETQRRVPPPPRKSERGQAIVIMAALMVSLIAVLGLAVDGGGVYFLWRDLQNATDAAAIAAAAARCAEPPGDAASAAQTAIIANGLDVIGDPKISFVLRQGSNITSASGLDDRYLEVEITAEKPAYFIDIVYKEPLVLTNHAISVCVERFDPTTVPAIMGIGTDCNNNEVAVTSAGGEIIGGIHSNGYLQFGASGQGFDVYGDVSAVDGISSQGGSNVNLVDGPGDPNAAVKPNPVTHITLQMFAPGGDYWGMVPDSDRHYIDASDPDFNAGNGTWNPRGRTLKGLYYVAGNVKASNTGGPNGNVWDSTWPGGGVTIVAEGTIDIGMGSGMDIQHYKPPGVSDFPGILFFSEVDKDDPECTVDTISFSGSEMEVIGILLAPYGACGASLSEMFITGAILCYSINASGSDIIIHYDPALLPPIAPSVTLAD